MMASPSISVFSERPGPEVAVMAFFPANDAPTTAPRPAISSLRLEHGAAVPPQVARERPCMISVDGVIG
jgi:hypothetical protein